MTSKDEMIAASGQSTHDVISPDGSSRSGWLARLVGLWTARAARRAPSPNGSASVSLAAPDKTVFVLLGGGARGAAQAGALAVVLEQGVRPDVIIGVSAGAWNGAYLAVNPTAERARELCAIWAGLKNSDLLGGGWWRAAVSAVSGRASLYSAEGPIRVARRYMDRQSFAELQVKLYILATNLSTGQPKLFSSGRVLPAVLASSAVPGIFPPVILDKQVYVDGGLLEWDACAEALRLGAQCIYLFGCGSIGELSPRLTLPKRAARNAAGKAPNWKGRSGKEQPDGEEEQDLEKQNLAANLLDVLERSWDVVSHYQFHRAVQDLRAGGARVVSIDPHLPQSSRALDFNHSEALITAGRAAAEAALALETMPATT
jgi:predicted acylesterase/phospholipase RssA